VLTPRSLMARKAHVYSCTLTNAYDHRRNLRWRSQANDLRRGVEKGKMRNERDLVTFLHGAVRLDDSDSWSVLRWLGPRGACGIPILGCWEGLFEVEVSVQNWLIDDQ